VSPGRSTARAPRGARLARWTCAALCSVFTAILGWAVGAFGAATLTLALDIYPTALPFQWVGASTLGGSVTACVAGALGLRRALRRLPQRASGAR